MNSYPVPGTVQYSTCCPGSPRCLFTGYKRVYSYSYIANLHVGEWYRLKVKLRLMKQVMAQNIQQPLEAQSWYALIPQGDMQVKRFEFAQLVDIEYDSGGKALLFKFVVDPSLHPGGVIMVLRGFMSSYLVTDQMERKRKKARLRDQELREFISRNYYDYDDGPKKLRTVR